MVNEDVAGDGAWAPGFQPPPPGLPEFEVGETFQVSDRGAVALAAREPWPWWPVAAHRVRVSPPGADPFEAEAHVEMLRARDGVDRMALLLVHVQQAQLPVGSRVVSLGYRPGAEVPEVSPFPRPWWQFWKAR